MTVLYRALWGDDADEHEVRVAIAKECVSRWILDGEASELEAPEGTRPRADDAGTRRWRMGDLTSGTGFGARIWDAPRPDAQDQTLWTVEVRVVSTPSGVQTMVELSMDSDDPLRPVKVGGPRLVDELLAVAEQPKLGDSNLVDEVLDVTAADVQALIDYLKSETRVLPVVVVTPVHGGERDQRRVAEHIQKRARGVVVVAYLEQGAVTEMKTVLGDGTDARPGVSWG